jgi:predicted RNA binding protein YcfA (HicA-like mRNA interferase family)
LRLKHPDGRVVTVPMHQGQDIRRGLLRKILRDADLTVDEFIA